MSLYDIYVYATPNQNSPDMVYPARGFIADGITLPNLVEVDPDTVLAQQSQFLHAPYDDKYDNFIRLGLSHFCVLLPAYSYTVPKGHSFQDNTPVTLQISMLYEKHHLFPVILEKLNIHGINPEGGLNLTLLKKRLLLLYRRIKGDRYDTTRNHLSDTRVNT